MTRSTMGPNVLLVVLDTARADAFTPYGAPAASTPTVAQLAAAGAALAGIAPASWTVPSHASMFTGLLPRSLGLGQAPGGTPAGCRPLLEARRERLLAEVFRRAGWATAGVSANLWVTEQSGFDVGFDRWVTVRSPRRHDVGARRRARARWALDAVRARVDDGATAVENLLVEWLTGAGRDGRPFFWFVNLVECHSPYLPPRPYNDLSPLQRLRAGDEAHRHLTLDGIWRACTGGFDVPDAALARMRHLYGRAVTLMDDWLARVLDALDAHGLGDETLVVVTSDHGENLGEGRLLGHAFSLDDRLIRVPLVLAGPGADVAASGTGVVSLTDLPRRLAAAAGLAEHPWGDGPGEPVAVAQLDPLAPPDDPRLEQAARDWGVGTEGVARMSTPLTCATDGRLKLLRRGEEDVLFDLATDPLELAPRPPSGNGHDHVALAALRRAVDAAAGEHAVAPAPAPPSTDAAVPLDDAEREDLERRMRLMGYL